MWMPSGRFKLLEENEIAGAGTMNPVLEFVRGIRSTSDFIVLNPNANNSMNIEFDEEALHSWLFRAYPHNKMDEHSFKATANGGSISCTGGSVWFPFHKASIGSLASTSMTSNGIVYVRLTSKTEGTLRYGTPTHTLQPDTDDSTDGGNRVILPICRTVLSGSTWTVQYLHMGDFVFIDEPYFYVNGYQKNKNQALSHRADENGLEWLTYGDCSESA